MPRLSALKLVDRAIVPAMIVIASKILAIFVASMIFNIPWEINSDFSQNNFLFLQFGSQEELAQVINFSDIITILVCGFGFTWSIFQAVHLNFDYTHPNLIARLIKKGKEIYLTTTGQIYHRSAIWLALTWLVFFGIMIDVYQGLTTTFVLGVSLGITLALTFAFYQFTKNA